MADLSFPDVVYIFGVGVGTLGVVGILKYLQGIYLETHNKNEILQKINSNLEKLLKK